MIEAMASSAHPGPRLTDQLVDSLIERLRGGEWEPGDRLPPEHQLADHYGVSRPTVRTALRQLESLGLTSTRHGSGTFATRATSSIRADLRRLDSLSATVASYGMEPKMSFRSRVVRGATVAECERLGVDQGSQVFSAERALEADDVVVAFSYDVIDRALLGEGFSAETVDGSLFSLLAAHGVNVVSAITEVHAVADSSVGWGRRPRRGVYLLLSQVHYDRSDRPAMFSNTYFIEGRFTFSLARMR